MPATATAGPDEICCAAQDIMAEKRRVTGYSLRAQLGGRGDPRRLVAVWEQSQQSAAPTPDQPPAAAAVPLPPDLAARAAALREQMATQFDAAIAAAWALAERRAGERLGNEVADAQKTAETARRAQGEADEALVAADVAFAAVAAERDQLTAAAAEASASAARAGGERDAAANDLAIARAVIASAERREAAAEAAREAALATARQAQEQAREAVAGAAAIRERAAADVATARAEAAAARASAEETRCAANAATQRAETQAADLRLALGRAEQQARAAAEDRGRLLQRLETAETRFSSPASIPAESMTLDDPGPAEADDLPVVPDRLGIPKAERAAYDDGMAAGRNGWEEKSPRRFQPGQRLEHLLPYRRAGYRDGLAARAAVTASAEASSTIRDRPPET